MSQPLSVNASPQMRSLLADDGLTQRIAILYPDLQRIFTQTMLDVTSEKNRDTVGATILGIKNALDVLLLFRAKGEALIETEKQKEKQNAARTN